jgi:hypothetical protein
LAADTTIPQRTVAEAQKDDIRARLTEGMHRISDDLDRSYDSARGFSRYPANGGRVSVAEVLRRSGGVDKNTLKKPYHSETRQAVQDFVRRAQARCLAHAEADERRRAAEVEQKADSIERFAQLLYASQYKHDRTIAEAEALRQELAEKDRRIAELVREVQRLQLALADGKVVRLPKDAR